jgi:hypothetical protein
VVDNVVGTTSISPIAPAKAEFGLLLFDPPIAALDVLAIESVIVAEPTLLALM